MVCKNRNPFSLFQDAMFASILQCSTSYHCDTLDPNHQKRISFRLPVTFHNVCLSPTCAVLDHGPQSRNLDKQLRTCYWLVVSTHLKNMSRIGNLPQFSGWKLKKYLSCHQLAVAHVFVLSFFPDSFPKAHSGEFSGLLHGTQQSFHRQHVDPWKISRLRAAIRCEPEIWHINLLLMRHSIYVVIFTKKLKCWKSAIHKIRRNNNKNKEIYNFIKRYH